MGILKTLLPTPGKILFMVLLLPLVILLLLSVFGFIFAISTFSLFTVIILSVVISYVLVSVVYELFKKAVTILIAILVAGLIFSWLGLSLDPVKYTVNTVLNDNFNEIDTACLVDTDCVVKPVDCSACSGVDTLAAVNTEWKTWCPFEYKETELCGPLPSLNATCVNNQCQIAQDEP